MNKTNNIQSPSEAPQTLNILSFLRLINNSDGASFLGNDARLELSPQLLLPVQDSMHLIAQGLSVEIAKLTNEISSLSEKNDYLASEKRHLSTARRQLAVKKNRALANINYLASPIGGISRSSTPAETLEKSGFFKSPKSESQTNVASHEPTSVSRR